MAIALTERWSGEIGFLLGNLLLKDFRVRYRNMSLGFGWSIASPLVMMGVLTLVFTRVLGEGQTANFPVFVLCGLVPFSFFSVSLVNGTVSLVDNAQLIKRVAFPREIIPISTVLATAVHFAIQMALLLSLVLIYGYRPGWHWMWLLYVAFFEILFACGLALMLAVFDVYIRDMRYVVESGNTVLFWLVPVFYRFETIPERFHWIYRYNPVAAVVMAFRNILMEGRPPADTLLVNLTAVSLFTLAVGFLIFRRLRRRLFDYL